MKKVCVIGGGPAGLMSAYVSASEGNEVVLFEKNEKLGKKIYITGKGRCNFTNYLPADEFLENVVRGKKFMTGALYSFPPQKTIDFMEENGLSVKIERGNRAFPSSDHASDVTKTLEKACKRVGVSIHLKEKVLKIQTTMPDISIMPRIVGVLTEKGYYDFDAVIVATGGISYPATGSTGDGYQFAKDFGLKVTDLKAGLCGFNLKRDVHLDLQGISLKNVSLSAFLGDKKVYDGFGEMLFTHFGISGPIVLTLSSYINRLNLKETTFYIDFKPALDEGMLDKRILRDFEEYKNKQISNALLSLLPHKLITPVLKTAQIPLDKSVHLITKQERGRLVQVLKKFPLKPLSLRDFSEAIITSGGVDLTEINPKNMSSKKVDGLRFCGEVLDVDALTGGFNMQIAFSTGYLAGKGV